jgi:hypothetical protein
LDVGFRVRVGLRRTITAVLKLKANASKYETMGCKHEAKTDARRVTEREAILVQAEASGRPHPWWVPLTRRFFGLTPRQLRSDELDMARELLYEVYFVEQGWDPPQPNASELHANHEQRRMEDRFDHEAIWVGVFDRGGKLVGTTRIIDRSISGCLELECYVSLPRELQGPRVVEGNRVAVYRAHRNKVALMCLSEYSVWLSRRRGAVRFVGAASRRVALGPANDLGWRHTGLEFRYHPEDPELVYVLRREFNEPRRRRALFKIARRQFQRALSRSRA